MINSCVIDNKISMTKEELINDLLEMSIITEEEANLLMGPNLEPLKEFEFWKEWKSDPTILT